MGWGGVLRTWLFTLTYKRKLLEGLSRGLIRSDLHLKCSLSGEEVKSGQGQKTSGRVLP